MIEYNEIKFNLFIFTEVFLFMDISQIPYYFSEYIMHFDKYIPMVMASYGSLIYFILFMIIFCETGLVVTPFLPGDSLLFACGALSATANSLHFGTLFAICLTAAILGDTSNYWIGESSVRNCWKATIA